MKARHEVLENIAEAQRAGAGRKAICQLLGLSIRTVQRWAKKTDGDGRRNNRFSTSNALRAGERQEVVDVACSPEYRDKSPNQIVPILAEKGRYIASESTFYRILRRAGLMTHRSRAKAPERSRPDELTATGQNQVWTWDISYLPTLRRGVFLYLYFIMDIWDRSIVGWAVNEVESGQCAAELLNETCIRHGAHPGQLNVHQDNGSPMISGEFLAALSFWGVPSYSRPGVSDDNPYSESLFRTAKYRPNYPDRFETLADAVKWIQDFVRWYNTEHRHSAIGFVTPEERRSGMDFRILETRRETYKAARISHPERWSRNTRRWNRPESVTLNQRQRKNVRQELAA